jgi:hypothetical protein
MATPRGCQFAVVSLMLQKPVSLCLVEFPVPTVAVKLEDDSAVRIGLPAIEAAVRIDLGGASPHRMWLTELLGWTRTSLGRGVLAIADVARIAVNASAVIRVFMTMLLCNIRPAQRTSHDCTEDDNFVRI